MASNSFGEAFRFTTFGESHGAGIGVIVDGVPAGLAFDEAAIQRELDRRRPGQSALTTPRKETDAVHVMSGVFEGKTTGCPIGMLIYNGDAVSTQYDNIKDLYRPGHADYTYHKKYGVRDYRGSGRASGRETACRVAAGALAKQLLAQLQPVTIFAGAVQVGEIKAKRFVPEAIEANPARCVDPDVAPEMEKLIKDLAAAGDSVGGVIECRVGGLPAGLGEPLYHKLTAALAYGLFSLGAIKGLEFGDGFGVATLRGSENNDPLTEDGFATNHAGGTLGGMSTGQELVMRLAVKPTSSIAKTQQSIGTDGKPVEFAINGRHDPCLIPRLVPVVEAMVAAVLADMVLLGRLARAWP